MSEALDPYRRALEIMEAGGPHLNVVIPPADVVVIDLDANYAFAVVDGEVQSLLYRHQILRFGNENSLMTRSRNGNAHVYYRLTRPLPESLKVAIQAALGSDRLKEGFAIMRIFHEQDQAPSVLFETDEEFEKYQRWLATPAPIEEDILF